MFEICQQDEAYLKKSLEGGDVVLVLGAGASATSLNSRGECVKQADALAKTLAEKSGLPYDGEPLQIVLGAIRPILSDAQIYRVYESEYKNVRPSNELCQLVNYTWRRIYTWCIDDAFENVNWRRVQSQRIINGIHDPVVDEDNLGVLQVIKLHGSVSETQCGFIMTESEYATAISSNKHSWYRKLAQDYIGYTPVFVGSRLAEPILTAELERAKRDALAGTGRAYLITPDKLSTIHSKSLCARGIIHIRATLADFASWLKVQFPRGITPRSTVSRTNSFPDDVLNGLTDDDIATLRALFPINVQELTARIASVIPADKDQQARHFLRGSPPTWMLSASDIPVWLQPTNGLYDELCKSIKQADRLLVVTGQAGSGKTTAVMQSLVRYGREHKGSLIFELRGEVRSVLAALRLLIRLHSEHVIVYVGDLFVFGDSFGSDILSIDPGRITVVATARSSEWREYLSRYLIGLARVHEYSRFTKSDYEPIISRLLSYVPAPAFTKLSKTERTKRFANSKNQLLIALREATDSENFNDIITNEYEKLPDDDSRMLLVIVAIPTIARVGISVGVAKEVYSTLFSRRSFEQAEAALDGIVVKLPNGRFFARHELYVRHIVDNLINLDQLIRCQIGLLSVFTKYRVPVVRSINRVDATLFRFILNHDFLLEQCKKRGRSFDGLRLYSEFEVSFQLDGHFWLQYGLYNSACGRTKEALTMLQRSIQAYPDNPFAVHAYAQLELQVAIQRKEFDAVTSNLIGDAVKRLLELDTTSLIESDHYPIVTLANFHVEALVAHNKNDDAMRVARQYFSRLQEIVKTSGSAELDAARDKLLRFVTLRRWEKIGSKKLRRDARIGKNNIE